MTAPNEQEPEMTEEKAREILETFKDEDETTRATRSDSFLCGRAVGYLARVEQERQALTRLENRITLLEAALLKADDLISRLDFVHNNDEYFSVWQCAQIHQGPYKGPKYDSEMAQYRAARERVRLDRRTKGV